MLPHPTSPITYECITLHSKHDAPTGNTSIACSGTHPLLAEHPLLPAQALLGAVCSGSEAVRVDVLELCVVSPRPSEPPGCLELKVCEAVMCGIVIIGNLLSYNLLHCYSVSYYCYMRAWLELGGWSSSCG